MAEGGGADSAKGAGAWGGVWRRLGRSFQEGLTRWSHTGHASLPLEWVVTTHDVLSSGEARLSLGVQGSS